MKQYSKAVLCLAVAVMVWGCQSDKAGSAQDTAEVVQEQAGEAETMSAAAPAQSMGQGEKAHQAIHPGKALHDSHCIACHDSGRYSGGQVLVKTPAGLTAQLQRCNARYSTGERLNEAALKSVSQYLQQVYYRFPESAQ